ncbi:hypothetical protein JR311_19810 (plasmid) [Bacillus velezensis]|uniref:hypothetical protein n=1 Tax=Bacillus velezensis TaxID=492670 RepID=UPI00195BBBFA|nr:hypothetical protein [Bacillus velezensis]QRV11457.1 hypothetical protein JR311_19810 [Bacillus velezensis]
MKANDIIITAELKNKKRVVLEPNYSQRKCHYRYMTVNEVMNNSIDVNKKHVWLETRIFTTTEDGFRIIFANIEGTAIVLNKI